MRVLSVNAERRDDYTVTWVAIEDAIIDVLFNGTLILDFKKITEDDMSNVLMDAIRSDEDKALNLGIVLKNIDWLDDIVVSRLSLEIKRYDNYIEVKINRMVSLTVGSKEDMPSDLCKHRIEELKKYFPKDTIIDLVWVRQKLKVKKPKIRKYKAKVSISDKNRHITLKELGDLKDVKIDSEMSSWYPSQVLRNDPFQYHDYDHSSYLYLFFENATIVVNYSGNSRTCLYSPTSIILESLTKIGSDIVTMHNYDGVLNIYLKFNEYIKIKMKIENYHGLNVNKIHVGRTDSYDCTPPGIYIFMKEMED